MKIKNLLLGLTLLFSTVALAQEKGDFNAFAGGTAALGTGSLFGVNAGVEYVFAENFSVAPSFTYYFGDATQTAVNIDARYYLGDDSFNWFATAGIGFNSISVPAGAILVGSSTATGIRGGAGALFSISDNLDLLAIVAYDSAVSGVVPMVGVSFGL
ncbi:MAG: hypothetical protein WAO74_06560 [Polaribacter sp.]|uniref:hypothetical protein n=1 Tax=Polaribacter sp. TaxID=1920175 RepID=UPI003BB1C922